MQMPFFPARFWRACNPERTPQNGVGPVDPATAAQHDAHLWCADLYVMAHGWSRRKSGRSSYSCMSVKVRPHVMPGYSCALETRAGAPCSRTWTRQTHQRRRGREYPHSLAGGSPLPPCMFFGAWRKGAKRKLGFLAGRGRSKRDKVSQTIDYLCTLCELCASFTFDPRNLRTEEKA